MPLTEVLVRFGENLAETASYQMRRFQESISLALMADITVEAIQNEKIKARKATYLVRRNKILIHIQRNAALTLTNSYL